MGTRLLMLSSDGMANGRGRSRTLAEKLQGGVQEPINEGGGLFRPKTLG